MKYIKRFFNSIFFIEMKMFFSGYEFIDVSELDIPDGMKVRVFEGDLGVYVYTFTKEKVEEYFYKDAMAIIAGNCILIKLRLMSNGDVRLITFNFSEGKLSRQMLPYEVYGDNSFLRKVEVYDDEGYQTSFGKIAYSIETKNEPTKFVDENFNIVLDGVKSYRFIRGRGRKNEYILSCLCEDGKFYLVDSELVISRGYDMIMFGDESFNNFKAVDDQECSREYTLPLIGIYSTESKETIYQLITNTKACCYRNEYIEIYPSKDGKYILARDMDWKYGYLDIEGNNATYFKYAFLSPVTNGRCFAKTKTSSFVLLDVEHNIEYGRLYRRIHTDFKEINYGTVPMELALVETYDGLMYIDRDDKKHSLPKKNIPELEECYLTTGSFIWWNVALQKCSAIFVRKRNVYTTITWNFVIFGPKITGILWFLSQN